MFAAAVAVSAAVAQGPGGGEDLAARMMAFDKDGDGKLTRTEITDQRLTRLFDRADADKDGQVTKDELNALATKEHSDQPDFGGPGGPPPGFMGGFPRPGEVLPAMLRRDLKLTPEQTGKLDALQKQVDQSLDEILTADQKTQLKELRSRGPRGFGPPGGGRRGAGGPGRPSGPGGSR